MEDSILKGLMTRNFCCTSLTWVRAPSMRRSFNQKPGGFCCCITSIIIHEETKADRHNMFFMSSHSWLLTCKEWLQHMGKALLPPCIFLVPGASARNLFFCYCLCSECCWSENGFGAVFPKSAVTLAFTGSNQSQVAAADGNERTEKEGGIDGYNCWGTTRSFV